MVVGALLEAWIDREGWIVIAVVTATAVMIFGGALKSPALTVVSFAMPALIIVLFAALRGPV